MKKSDKSLLKDFLKEFLPPTRIFYKKSDGNEIQSVSRNIRNMLNRILKNKLEFESKELLQIFQKLNYDIYVDNEVRRGYGNLSLMYHTTINISIKQVKNFYGAYTNMQASNDRRKLEEDILEYFNSGDRKDLLKTEYIKHI